MPPWRVRAGEDPSAPPLGGHRTWPGTSLLVLDELVYRGGVFTPISDCGLVLNTTAP